MPKAKWTKVKKLDGWVRELDFKIGMFWKGEYEGYMTFPWFWKKRDNRLDHKTTVTETLYKNGRRRIVIVIEIEGGK